jgi:hypothetical protein
VSGWRGVAAQTNLSRPWSGGELATCPPDDIGIDPFQGRTQLRLVEVAVVGDPAADARVVHLSQLSQGFVAAVMQRPAADITADARQRLRAGGGLETVREDAPVRLHPHDLSGSKLEAEKVEGDVGEVAAPVHILSVDDLRLLWMQHQLAGREAVRNRTPECPRLLGALIHFRQYGHRCGGSRAKSSRMAWRTAGKVG